MRIEQRIGRVDRIGQHHVVRAINFVLEDTVEHRVRQVLEEKLEVIAQEFGVDKASDVMDSVEADPMFDELFVHGLQNPDAIEQECDAVVSQLRTTLAESKKNSALLSEAHDLDAGDARKWRDHPAQFWLGTGDHQRLGSPRGLGVKGWQGLAGEMGGWQRIGSCMLRRPDSGRKPRTGLGNAGRPPGARHHQRIASFCRRAATACDSRDGFARFRARHLVAVGNQPRRRGAQPQALPSGVRD
jgi:hypothetical protein